MLQTNPDWEKYAPVLEKAIKGGTHTIEDVGNEVKAGRMQLWAKGDSAIVTQLLPFPRKLCIELFLIGGKKAEIQSLVDVILPHVRECGVKQARISGRPGLIELGFKKQAVFMTKEL